MPIIIVISLLLYLLAGVILYHNLYAFEKPIKVTFIIIGFIVVWFITMILNTISASSLTVGTKEMIGITKMVAIWLFAPINSIILLPLLANTLGKKKENAITQASYQRRLVLLVMIFIIMLIWENGYSKNFQMGLLKSVL